MKRLFFILLCVLTSLALNAHAAVSTFDDLTLASESYWNGSDGSGGFTSGGAYFTNTYNASWGSWDGWAYSNMTNTTTPGYVNQYSAITGGGAEGSANYGVYFEPFSLYPSVSFTSVDPVIVEGAYITNTTYAALSMRDGDSYAKKFGGATGDDPDWFKLSVRGIDGSGGYTEWLDFYLADYTYVNNDFDYIIDEWTLFDMRSLGAVIGLEFDLSSSDVGDWGMNTPAYFAMDNLSTVPIPGAIWLLVSGIVGLIGLRRKMA